MRIYQLTFYHSQSGHCSIWAGSKREAGRIAAGLRREDNRSAKARAKNLGGAKYWKNLREHWDFEINAVDFPTRKMDIVNWLCAHCNRGN